ncbi:hypothetical protein [Micromonospora rosaria]
MDCGLSPWTSVFDIFKLIGDPIGWLVRIIANLVLAAAITLFQEFTNEVPTLGEGPGGGMTVPGLISDQVEWLIVYLAVGSIIFAAAKMAMDRRGEAGKTALYGFLRVILVAGAGSWVAIKAAAVSDNFTSHLFTEASLTIIKSIPCIEQGTNLEGFLLLVVAFLLLISGIVHVLMLYIRLGVMILLLGTLPLAAAASMTDWGAGWWRKHIGWTIAWLLYKPAVGLIMFAGAEMLAEGNRQSWAHGRIAGVGILLLSAVALPALLKLVVPATAALGTGNPAGTAISATTGAVASGAKKIAGSALAHSGGGGGGSRGGGPSGSRDTGGGQGPAGRSSGGTSRTGRDGGSGRAGWGGSDGWDGGSGTDGASGADGGPGRDGNAGWDGRAGGTGSSGVRGAGSAAARLAGPAAAAIEVAHRGAQVGRQMATGAIEGGDGEAGHNR